MNHDDPHWYRDLVIYQTHVKAFFDASDDGIGDLRGLTSRLDYIHDLGVTAIWLLPFYPSPLRDDGYDIADYRAINPAYGTMGDFRRFVREAHARGLRVITELVVNHTSDQHPWFQRARRARPGSKWRDFYVWSDTDQRYQGTRIIFTDTETSNWTWDPVAKAYYWHRFFSHQPDLNFDNPRVVAEVVRNMRFWLDCGVDGLRLDAVPYLVEREGTSNENLPETHAVLKDLRTALDESHPGRMLLAEANQWPEDVLPYFGDGDECHMAFHFPLMPRLYMALAQEDRLPITDILRQTPAVPEGCQWAIFLRNHDELTLEMVTDRERDYLWSYYAADARMRVNVGIRRRLAPLLDNDRRKIELLNSLLLSMPGTPIVYYGDEIGMGDNVFLGDRDGVRTPMQWSPDRNAGFSRADPARLYLPPIMDPLYGYEAVNVEAQSRSPSSLLNWMRRIIAVRRGHQCFGRGELEVLYPGNRRVFAYLRRGGDETVLCVANLSRASQPVELDLSEFRGRVPVELLGRSPFPAIGELPYFVTLPAYGFYWFLLAEAAEEPSWHEPYTPPLPELLTLVTPQGWASLAAGQPRALLEARVLPEYLAGQRWFAAKDRTIRSVSVEAWLPISAALPDTRLCIAEVTLADGEVQRYLLPLAIRWERGLEDDPLVALLHYSIARVRSGPRLGVLYDALAEPALARAVVEAMAARHEEEAPGGTRLAFRPTAAFPADLGSADLEVRPLGQEQSNSSLLVGESMVLKLYRRLARGVHPEAEMGRFLTEVAGFEHTPPLLGAFELREPDGAPYALGVLQGFVRNQGDGWAYTLHFLERFLDDVPMLADSADDWASDHRGGYLELARRLGLRLGALHRALADGHGDPDFEPHRADEGAVAAWRARGRERAGAARRAMEGLRGGEGAADAAQVIERWPEVEAALDVLLAAPPDGLLMRIHGDLHLGQVIVVMEDVQIIDFEGEPAAALETRRARDSALRDVAGMLRSFDYAATVALAARAETWPEAPETLAPWTDDWKTRSRAAFLAGYREACEGAPFLPAQPAAFEALLGFFVLEKAFYECAYEAANRPGWLRIPVRGILEILDVDD